MSETHPEQAKHLFSDTYQGYELPTRYVSGAAYAPDPRSVWGWQTSLLPEGWSWEGKRVLDLAGNNGYHGIRALREGAEAAFLLEQHAAAIAKARCIAEAWDVPLVATQGDIEDFHWLKWGPFDVVFCHQVLYHLRRPIPLLREMWSNIRPGGAACIHSRIALNVHDKHWEWVPNRDTMERTLRHVGFREVRFFGLRKDLRAINSCTVAASGQRKVMVVALR